MREQRKTFIRVKRIAAGIFISIMAAVFVACSTSSIQSALHPKSPQAYQISILWWAMLAIGTLVLLATMALLAAAVLRRSEDDAGLSERQKWYMVIGGGVVAPVVVVFALTAYSTYIGRDTAGIPANAPITVEVTGHQWWWDVRYTTENGLAARTANEIHIPVGVPVKFILRSRDVIHSFWMPNFQGKTDLIPGRTNYTWVTATEPGIYRGQCAEFCGLQHAKMAFSVVAEPEEEFYAWLTHQSRPAQPPTTPEQIKGQQTFLTSQCVMCHAVRGTNALASVAPDLTHVGSRQTLASGILPNTRGHLGGWIANPQTIKPGARMPNMFLSNEELTALIAYIESLK